MGIDIPSEQEVLVKIEDGREYPAILFGGRLDVGFLRDQLAQDGLVLTKLSDQVPYCDANGLSRAVFTTTIIKAQTTRHPGELRKLLHLFLYMHIGMPCNAVQAHCGSTVALQYYCIYAKQLILQHQHKFSSSIHAGQKSVYKHTP